MSMVHISYGMKEPGSPQLRSECAILAGMAQATLSDSKTPWQDYADDYDRIRDTMAQVLDGFEDFNSRARHPHGFRIAQPARERVFQTPSGRAEFSPAPLPDDVEPGKGRLTLTTVRSHDQFNTTIYSNDDRYRGLKGLRTVVFMNENDMRDRGLEEFEPRRRHELLEGRDAADGARLPGRPLRDTAQLRRRLHAGAERPLRDRRRQHAERATRDEAPRRRGDAQSRERTRRMTPSPRDADSVR